MSGANLENANQFVLTSVERAHSGVGFCPNAKIEECQIALATSGKKFVNVPPVHAGEDKGTIARRSPQHGEGLRQECGELIRVQFADGFDKIPVLGAPLSRRKARDRDIVRRIDKAHACAQAFTDPIDEGLIVGVATANVVATAGPDIADGCDRWPVRNRNLFAFLGDVELWNVNLEQVINLDRIEAGELEVEAQVDKLFQLCAEPLVVPCSVAGDPIKREVGAL